MSSALPDLSLALPGILKPITITPMLLLYSSSEIPVTPKAGRNALLQSDTLLKLTYLSLHSTSSQTLLGAPSDKNTFSWCAGWVKAAIKSSNQTLFRVVYCRHQASSTAGAQTPMRGGHSYLSLDDILSPPAEDMIDDIGEVSDDSETRRPNQRRFPTTTTGFHKSGTETSKVHCQTAAIPWSYPKLCSWCLCQLLAKPCCWWGCGLVTQARSDCESSLSWLFCQNKAYKKPPRCKSVVRMECGGWTAVQGFAWWVGFVLALWRVDGWVMIWCLLVRFWVSFWCFGYLIITSFIFIHEGLCWEFRMLGLIFGTVIFGKGIVAAIGLRVWLSCNW